MKNKMTYKDTIEWLKRDGQRLGLEANLGSRVAQEVVAVYEFHYKLPNDPGGQALLTIVAEEYLNHLASLNTS